MIKYILIVSVSFFMMACGSAVEQTTAPVTSSSPVPTLTVTPASSPVVDSGKNIECDVFDLTQYYVSNGYALPGDFDTLTSSGKVKIDMFDVPSQNSAGKVFPKLVGSSITLATNFGMSCMSNLDIPSSDNYTLYLGSDDGAKLFVDGMLVVNNDGNHSYSVVSVTKYLVAGKHKMKVVYYNGSGYFGLTLEWSSPSFGRVLITPSNFVK